MHICCVAGRTKKGEKTHIQMEIVVAVQTTFRAESYLGQYGNWK